MRCVHNHSRDLVVFSHPNHELAVFGLLQRRRPALLYLTDGGGTDRVEETRLGLQSLDLLDQATFLDHAEREFYQALLDVDVAFFGRVADQVASVVTALRPSQVFCDAVEHYNPVHDLSLPIVIGALARAGAKDTPVFEIPLIRQVPSAVGETYDVQRPSGAGAGAVWTDLTDQELRAKRRARLHVYTQLARQLGPVLSDLSDDHLAREVVVPAGAPLRAAEGVPRYEWRGERLLREGAVERVITFRDHFVPIARCLTGWPYAEPVSAPD